MRALTKIIIFLFAVVLAAALLSPPIYWLAHGTLDYPFHRYFSRIVQVAGIVLLFPLLWWLRIRSPREFGLARNPHGLRDLLAGLGVALLPVLIMAAAYLFEDVLRAKKDLDPARLLLILGTAAVVAVIEEFLFRGVLLGLCARAFGRWPAALGVSVLFAGVHFIKPSRQSAEAVGWTSGFQQITRVFDGAPPPLVFLFGFLSLVLAGLVLAYAALRTRSLWLPIGLHAGWICGQQGLQWYGKFQVRGAESLLPWVGPNVVSGAVATGLVPLAALLLSGALVWLYLRYAPRPEGHS